MKIAVTYDYGEVFQHFGHTEQFKLYNVEDGKVISTEIVGADGSGHEALADYLAGKGVDVLICGGIGQGAASALSEAGIVLCAGASGDADEAVAAWLLGQLENSGVNCDHHDHGEGHSCGDHDCGDHGCGGCHGCHHGPMIEGKNVGKKCRVHYRGTFNDGTQFDSSYDRGEPLEFICGMGMMIPGFDAAVAVMDVGETRQVHLMPEEAYGESDPQAVFTVETAQLPGSEDLTVGTMVYLQSMYGDQVPARVVATDGKTVTFDTNHEMAGKELNFTIELTDVQEA
ncbi:MAG: FKBP-type peptidyl-prolyl cis-trans isomerase [Oscillospiraceae bacterium]|nr:FKBP-type peptidyl-prolyl cis-trans isomerase [Oscillospiraceae bacterium]